MDFKTKIIDNGIEITEVISDDKEIIIPEEIEGKKVLSISNNAFKKCTNLEELILPDNIKELAPNLLFDNMALYSIKLPKNINKIYTNSIGFDDVFLTNVSKVDTNKYNKIVYDEANKLFDSDYEIYIRHNKAIEAYIPSGDKYICGVCYLSGNELKFKTYGMNDDITKYSLFSLLFLIKILNVNDEVSNSSCLFDDSIKYEPSESYVKTETEVNAKEVVTIKSNCRVDYIDDTLGIVYDVTNENKYLVEYSDRNTQHYGTNVVHYYSDIDNCSCGEENCIHYKAIIYLLKLNNYNRPIETNLRDRLFVVNGRSKKIKKNYLDLYFGDKYFNYISNKQADNYLLPIFSKVSYDSFYDYLKVDLNNFDLELINKGASLLNPNNYITARYSKFPSNSNNKTRIDNNYKNGISYNCFCKADTTSVCEHCMAMILDNYDRKYFESLVAKNIKIDKSNLWGFSKNSCLKILLQLKVDDVFLDVMASKIKRNKSIKLYEEKKQHKPKEIDANAIKEAAKNGTLTSHKLADYESYFYEIGILNDAYNDYDNVKVNIIDDYTIELNINSNVIKFSYNPIGDSFTFDDGKIKPKLYHSSTGATYAMIIKDKCGPYKNFYYNLFNDNRPLIELNATIDKRLIPFRVDSFKLLDEKDIDIIFDEYPLDNEKEIKIKNQNDTGSNNVSPNINHNVVSSNTNTSVVKKEETEVVEEPIETTKPEEIVEESKQEQEPKVETPVEETKVEAVTTNNNATDLSDFIIEKNRLKKYVGTKSNVVIPGVITEIGASAFSGKKIESVVIPEGVIKIYSKAFYNCKKLVNVTFPNSLLEIGNSAFEKCESLKDISFPSSLLEIGDNAFSWCDIREVTLPDSLTKLGYSKSYGNNGHTFSCNKSFKKIFISKNVTNIGDHPCYICESLETIEVD